MYPNKSRSARQGSDVVDRSHVAWVLVISSDKLHIAYAFISYSVKFVVIGC